MLAAALLTLALLGSAHACSSGSSCPAGIACRITKPALLVLNQETAKVIQTAFQQASYPDITGEKAVMLLGRVKYGLHSIQVSHLSIASSKVELVEAQSIDISIQNASVIFQGTLSYGYTSAWGLNIDHTVDFKIDSATDLRISTQLTSDSGRVRTNAASCHLSFHKLLLHLQGEHEPGWIQQLFTSVISLTLKLVLKGQICKEINVISNIMADFVQTRAASILSDGDIGVDISLTGPPDITATYLESHHKGHLVYKNVSEDRPLPAFAPRLLGTSRMLYFWFSEQVLDSLAKAAFQDGRLMLRLTGDEFKAVLETRGFDTNQQMFLEAVLETRGFDTNQQMFLELFSNTPISQTQVTVYCLKRPKIACQNKGVVVTSSVVVKFLFPNPDGQSAVAHTFEEDIVTTVQASYAKKKLSLRLLDVQYEQQRGEGGQSTQQTCSPPSAVSDNLVGLTQSVKMQVNPAPDRGSLACPGAASFWRWKRLEEAFTALMNSKGLDLFDIINPEITPRDGFLLLQMDFGFPEHLLVDFLQSLS
ncbi:Cholesteryl ester transfer protein [Sciurus carolinensis]|uniref:Cholesteryl ester transfer protein n=1 Tax=Sciurus carolinensis TaxID=30640 RepID=A0AA41NGW7_SCICA|nr:Cholesteryl ester transfer protein [Sciurus carolinensis]